MINFNNNSNDFFEQLGFRESSGNYKVIVGRIY